MSDNFWIDEIISSLPFARSNEFPWTAPPRPTDIDFQRLAAAAGGRVPHEYRHFITRCGDVLFGDEDFTVEAPILEPCSWGESTRPETFYPLCPGHRWSLEDELETYRGRIPYGVIPISHDASGNQVCLDVAGKFPDSVWFWDHEQRWFTGNLQQAADELEAAGIGTRRLSLHHIIHEWARRHAERFDRPPDYMGMYRMAPSFADFLRSLHPVP